MRPREVLTAGGCHLCPVAAPAQALLLISNQRHMKQPALNASRIHLCTGIILRSSLFWTHAGLSQSDIVAPHLCACRRSKLLQLRTLSHPVYYAYITYSYGYRVAFAYVELQVSSTQSLAT